jgi:hypothetical protein
MHFLAAVYPKQSGGLSSWAAGSLVLLAAGAAAGEPDGRHTPVHMVGIINRQKPEPPGTPWFSPGELEVIAQRYEVVCGLDGHGYNFPGALPQVLARNSTVEALAYWEAMAVGGSRLAAVDLDEDNFLHSGDPASLTATVHNGETLLFFLQDGRGRVQDYWYTPPGVIEYVVEVATQPGRPFTQLGSAIPDAGLSYYVAVDPVVSSQRVYRVRTRIASTGQLVEYSGEVSANPNATSTLAVGRLFDDGSACAVCYGDCPTDPVEVVIEADLDNDKVYQADERFPCTEYIELEDGGSMYTGFVGAPDVQDHISHRIVLAEDPAVRVPLAGSYQTGMYNNRIQMHKFGNYLVWPNREDWLNHTRERLDAVLASGYAGMRLDFVLDTLALPWSASGVLHDWQENDPRVRDAMAAFLATLRAEYPQARFDINGYFAQQHNASYWLYLPLVDGADFEFFAIGHQSMSPVLQYSTAEAVESIWLTRAMGRRAFALAGAHEENHEGRLNVLAIYLLAADEGTFLYNETDAGCQDVTWLPEWEAPLGDPLEDVDDWGDLLDTRGAALLARQFAHGEVLLNCDNEPLTLTYNPKRYRLTVSGGLSKRVGGAGAATFEPVQQLTLGPDEGAVVLTSVPGDMNGDGALTGADVPGIFGCLGSSPASGGCAVVDFDGDNDVDLRDIGQLQVWQRGL